MTEAEESAQALQWADSLPAKTRQFTPPVDLLKIASALDVKRLCLQLMIPRGSTIAMAGGFEIYLRAIEERDLDVGGSEMPELLSSRQRFTLAHEITHTRFYVRLKTKPIPKPKNVFKDDRDLEEVCDQAAGRILVPTAMLEQEIKGKVGEAALIDAQFVHSTAIRFRSSPEVILERLRHVARNSFARGIVFVRMDCGRPVVRATYYGGGLQLILREPERHKPLTDWFGGIPREFENDPNAGEWRTQVKKGTLTFTKVPWRLGGAFFLQVDGQFFT